MPGSIQNPLARGSHRLLRDGASLVEEVDDILRELNLPVALAGTMTDTTRNMNSKAVSQEQHSLLGHMGFDPVDTDTLVCRSGLTTERVSSMLLLLELQGNIAALGGGRFQRCDK